MSGQCRCGHTGRRHPPARAAWRETGLVAGQRAGSRTRRARGPQVTQPVTDIGISTTHNASRAQIPIMNFLLSSGARRMSFVFPAWTGIAVGSLKGKPGAWVRGKASETAPRSGPEMRLGMQRPGVGVCGYGVVQPTVK